eukprot:TRINITY_DN41000_c0_g3_i1.p1 TRINITY_DN41000_c0_g3~~TRINITY_DN41000_c0_g3_i1.p1  ORF type:complete len:321 (+),score=94.13 TRINITY_DN41000_c0_g3_i1:247-1209(+)
MRSYLLIFRLGYKAHLEHSPQPHQRLQKAAEAAGDASYAELVAFQEASLKRLHYLVGQHEQHVRREVVEKIILDLAVHYGKWQDQECKAMKHDLLGLEGAAVGSGVAFQTFHDFPPSKKYGYFFGESQEYLRRIGALDEANEDSPRVLIANYLTGPTNCIATTQYTAVCCVNECEGPLGDLERKVRAPAATPSELLRLAQALQTDTRRHNQALPEVLQEQLRAAAEEAGQEGKVQLRGAPFAQWLHKLLPNECPQPILADYRAEEEHEAQAEEGEKLDRTQEHTGPSPELEKIDNDKAPLHHLLGDENCTRIPAYMAVVV